MSFYDREFVRRTRRAVRQVVRSQPQLRREARRNRQSVWSRHLGLAALRWAMPIFFAGLAFETHARHGFWLVFCIWSLLMALARAGQFQQICGLSAVVLMACPVLPAQVLREASRRCFRTSWWLAVDALVGIGVVSLLSSKLAWWGILPAALLVWASALATAVLLLWWRPQAKYATYSGALFTMGVVTMYIGTKIPAISPVNSEMAFAVLLRVTPVGWACEVAMWLVGAKPAFPVTSAGLLAFLIAYAVSAYRGFWSRFHLWAVDVPTSAEMTEQEARREDEDALDEFGPPIESRAAEVEERLIGGDFLRPFLTLGGMRFRWIERLVFACLRKQAVVLDFLLGVNPNWSGLYRFGWSVLAIGAVVAWVADRWQLGFVMPILGVSMFIAGGCTTPLFGGQWPGLRLAPLGQRKVALIAVLPIGLREISRTILAANALRFVLALPCWLAAFAILGWFSHESLAGTVRLGAIWWLITLLCNPFLLVFKYSAGTNDTSSGCLSVLVFLTVCAMPLICFGWVLLAIFVPARLGWQIAAFVTLGLTTYGLEVFYRWFYATKRFDLLGKPDA